MKLIHEKDCEYRHGDSGPKYFIHGPRLNFGIVRIKPGQVFGPHVHHRMEEDFYVIEGQAAFVIDGVRHDAGPGDFIHMEPGEAHLILNDSDAPCVYTVTTAPFFEEGDKEAVDADWAKAYKK